MVHRKDDLEQYYYGVMELMFCYSLLHQGQ